MAEKGKNLVLQRKIFTNLTFPNAAATALTAYFLVAYAILQAPVFQDPDSAWHLAAGQWMLEHRALTRTDPWSFTADGQQVWYNLSWLYDITVAWVYEHAGLTTIWLLVLLAASAMSGFLMTLCIRAGGGFMASVITVGLSGFILLSGTQFRPHWVSFFLAAIFYCILDRGRHIDAPRRHWCLPLLMVVWVNCHGAFPVGLSVLGAFWLEALKARRFRYASELAAVGGISACTVFINPYGPELITGMMRTLDSVITGVINEWMPVSIGRHQILITAHLALTLAVFHIGAARLKLADVVLTLFWIIAGLASIRYYFFAVILSAPGIAVCLRASLEQSAMGQWYRIKDADFSQDCAGPNGRRNAAALWMVVALALAVPQTRSLLWNAPIAYATDKAPASLVKYLKDEHTNSRILNDYSLGGFLIFHAGDTVKVFIDGRAGTVYSEKVLQAYLDLVRYQPNALSMLDEYRINAVALSSESRLIKALKENKEWKTGYDQQGFTVMVRPPMPAPASPETTKQP